MAWPLAASAQPQGDRVRRIGVLTGFDENDPLSKSLVSSFTQALADLGWTDGGTVRMDLRLSGVDINRLRALAHELVGLQPDIILAGTRQAKGCPPAGDADDPDRLWERDRPCHQPYRRGARPPGWEHHRQRQPRSLAGRQVA